MSSETRSPPEISDVPVTDGAEYTDPSPPSSATTAVAGTGFPSLSPRRIARWMLVTATLFGIGWLLWSARSVLLPFQIGLVLAYLVLPLVNWLEQQRLPRWLAIIAVYLGGLFLIVAFFAYIVPPLIDQINQFINQFPSLDAIEAQAFRLFEEYQRTVPPAVREPLDQGINQAIETVQNNLTTYVQSVGTFLLSSVLQVINTVTFILGFLIVPFWLFYVLKDQGAGFAAINRMLPAAGRADFWAIVKIIDRVFSGYIRGQLFLGLVVGIMAGIGLLVLGLFGLKVDFILILAIIAGVTELIPIIGPIIGAIPAIVLGLFHSPTTGLAVLILYIAIQQLENNLLVPRIVGDSVGIHPAILMVLLLVLGHLYGLIGIILSAPLGAIARDIFVYIHGRLEEPARPAGVLPKRSGSDS